MTTSRPNVWRKSSASSRDVDARLGVLAVDVEDRHLDHLGDVGAVPRRAGVARVGGEADLVVDDDVDRAAGPVAGELQQVQRLGHEALAGERGVAVDQDRHAELAVGVVVQPLLGPHAALDHRVDGLQVAGVGRRATGGPTARRRCRSRRRSRGGTSRRRRRRASIAGR